MLEVCITGYIVLAIPGGLILWSALRAGKRADWLDRRWRGGPWHRSTRLS